MFRDLFFTLINLLITEPAKTELSARLAQLGAPQTIMRDVASCVSAASPVLTETYIGDPVRGVLTAARIWTGMTTYEAVLQADVPACGPVLQAAQPYLSHKGS
ncbi:hypothetical protein [Muricoccus aerilatus]|uniref:hypothetical protein n=1 Tax=Muricoccus aerilatus TaxID=452982 RepID=UPI0005C135C7|nr:hypothetical protein [Roseomonas aerilata]